MKLSTLFQSLATVIKVYKARLEGGVICTLKSLKQYADEKAARALSEAFTNANVYSVITP
jgi:hypothetical protein